jgi:competence protein ComEC
MLEKFLQKSPFLRAVLPFCTGIALANAKILISPGLLIPVTIVLFLVAAIIAFKGGFVRNLLSGLAFNLFFLFAGATTYTMRTSVPEFPGADYYVSTLLETPGERAKTWRAEVTVTAAGQAGTIVKHQEQVIVYFLKSDSLILPSVGEQIIFFTTPSGITNDDNPYAFDYRGYMQRRQIYRQVMLSERDWQRIDQDAGIGSRVLAEKTREQLLAVYERSGLSGDGLAILSALTLGYRKTLDPEIRQTFANSGAMHVLAVSGLHVGIVFMAFRLLFSFFNRYRWGRWVYVVAAVLVLWGYAFLTGLSPSVQRAALMFSLIQIGEGLRRPVNVYNTLATSAFILLCFNPVLLFEVGFQLSYSAVLGIVYFQPRMAALFQFRNKIASYLWGLFTVSLAAQMGTFAVSSFYFRQFPVWFWISNFVVIPAAFLFIVLAAGILVFSFFPVISSFLALISGKLVSWVLVFLKTIEALPGAVYAGFHFNYISLLASLLAILLLVLFIESRRKLFLFMFTGVVIGFVLNNAVLRFNQENSREFIVYKNNEPVIHLIDGRTNYLFVPPEWIENSSGYRAADNVINAMCLDSPVVLSHDSDFEDAQVLKHGGIIFFGNTKIGLRELLPLETPLDKLDYIIDFRRGIQYESQATNSKIISYLPVSTPENTGLYSLFENGPIRVQL